jgi:hypothetical protein
MIGLRPSYFETWSNIGWMNRMYGQYSWFNFVPLSKRQLESKFVSLAQPKIALGNRNRPERYNWVLNPSYFEK